MDYGEASGNGYKEHNFSSNDKNVKFPMQFSTIDPVCGSGSKFGSTTNRKGTQIGLAEGLGYSNHVASSAHNSASVLLNPQAVPQPRVQIAPKPSTIQFVEKNDVLSGPLHRLGKDTDKSSEVISQVADILQESSVPSISWVQSPPIQMMERPVDANRIPSSIFSRPSSPLEWSIASNDSLFSIRIGNNSLPRDHKIIEKISESVELPESAELVKTGEESCQTEDNERQNDLESSGELTIDWHSPQSVKGIETHENLNVPKNINVHPQRGERTVVEFNDFPKPLINSQFITNAGMSGGSSAEICPDKSESIAQSSFLPKKKKSTFPLQAICCLKWLGCCSCNRPAGCSSCKYAHWPRSCSSCKCVFWPGRCTSCECFKWPGNFANCNKCFCWPGKCSSCECFHWSGNWSSCNLHSFLSCFSSCKASCCSCNCFSFKWSNFPTCSLKWYISCLSCHSCCNKWPGCHCKCPSCSSACCSCFS